MNYRWFIFFCGYVFVTAFSCNEGINYKASEKYRHYGKVTDQEGNPLSDVAISLTEVSTEVYYNSTSNCTSTNTDGLYDFIVSNGNGGLVVLSANFEGNTYCSLFSHQDLDNKQVYLSDSNYVDYELEIDFILEPSVPLHLVSDNAYVSYTITHQGITDLTDLDYRGYLDYISRNDTIKYLVLPNQEVALSYIDTMHVDTTFFVGTEPVFFNF
jgi:hypothetical protein